MQQSFILDFLKELSIGFKSAKSYPPGHPIMEQEIIELLPLLKQIAISSIIRLSHPETKAILEEFSTSKDKFLAGLAQSALKS